MLKWLHKRMGVGQSKQQQGGSAGQAESVRQAAAAEATALRTRNEELEGQNKDLFVKLQALGGTAIVGCAALAAFSARQRKSAVELLTRTSAQQKSRIGELQAEATHARRRAAIEVENANKFAVQKFAKDMLGICDNLERARSSASCASSDLNDVKHNLENLSTGVVLTHKELLKTLGKHGVVKHECKPFDSLSGQGADFDPNRHEAVGLMPNVPKNKIASVEQTGYSLGDRVLRPARVRVGYAEGEMVDKPENIAPSSESTTSSSSYATTLPPEARYKIAMDRLRDVAAASTRGEATLSVEERYKLGRDAAISLNQHLLKSGGGESAGGGDACNLTANSVLFQSTSPSAGTGETGDPAENISEIYSINLENKEAVNLSINLENTEAVNLQNKEAAFDADDEESLSPAERLRRSRAEETVTTNKETAAETVFAVPSGSFCSAEHESISSAERLRRSRGQ